MAEKRFQIAADIAGGVMWWWILWHVFTDYGHIIVSTLICITKLISIPIISYLLFCLLEIRENFLSQMSAHGQMKN